MEEYGVYVFPIILWSFLPSIASSFLQKAYYKSLANPPQPNSYEHNRDKNRSYILVVSIFIIYSIFAAESSLGVNYYGNLNIGTSSDSRGSLKSQSLLFHPDKFNGVDAHEVYIGIGNAYETLKDPMKRIAYDHFGPSVLETCEKCLTFREYLMEAFDSVYIFYGITFGVGLLFDVAGSGSFSPFWKFVVFLGLIAFEFNLLVSTDPFPNFMSWRTPHEKIQFARQLFIQMTIAMNQIGPFFFPLDNRSMKELLVELEGNVMREQEQSKKALLIAYTPFNERGGVNIGLLKKKMEQVFVEKTLEADLEWQAALKQLQMEPPALD